MADDRAVTVLAGALGEMMETEIAAVHSDDERAVHARLFTERRAAR
jgi:hypothetical protein